MVSAFPVPPFRAVDFRFNVSTLPGAYSPESAPEPKDNKARSMRALCFQKRYSAFSASMHPIPLPTLQKAAGGPFWTVLAVLRGLDVYAEGMERSGTAVLPWVLLLCFWENGLLGEALCRGRSPGAHEVSDLGVLAIPPLGGWCFCVHGACVRCARSLLNKALEED